MFGFEERKITMSRKLLAVLLVCAFLLPVAVTVSAQDATCTGDKVTLTVDDWSSADRVEYMNQVVDAFQQANPCVTVSLVPNIENDANTRRLTMIASGTAPDLIATGESWIPLYAEAGGFLDLTPFITGDRKASTRRPSSRRRFTIRVSTKVFLTPLPKTTAPAASTSTRRCLTQPASSTRKRVGHGMTCWTSPSS